MLGLHTRAGKDEIRRAYKEYVRIMHPDLNGGKVDAEATAKFQKLTNAYNEVMNMSADEFWLEAFDTGITRMATKRVDGPSLNPWERRFRAWARANDLLEVDDLKDEVDCRRQAKVYLDRCEEDPTLEGCDVARELVEKEMDDTLSWMEDVDVTPPPTPSSEPNPAAASSGSQEQPGGSPIQQGLNVVAGGFVAIAGAISLAVASIIMSAASG